MSSNRRSPRRKPCRRWMDRLCRLHGYLHRVERGWRLLVARGDDTQSLAVEELAHVERLASTDVIERLGELAHECRERGHLATAVALDLAPIPGAYHRVALHP